ncbi:hypothetical protein ACFX13_021581 [Malus domestica]
METREVYEPKLRIGNLHHDPRKSGEKALSGDFLNLTAVGDTIIFIGCQSHSGSEFQGSLGLNRRLPVPLGRIDDFQSFQNVALKRTRSPKICTMAKELHFNKDGSAIKKLQTGVNKLADLVKGGLVLPRRHELQSFDLKLHTARMMVASFGLANIIGGPDGLLCRWTGWRTT